MYHMVLLLVLGLVFASTGCQRQDQGQPESTAEESLKSPVSPDRVVTETKEALDAAAEYAQDQRDHYVAKFQQEIDELGTRIDALKSEAEGMNEEAKTKLEEVVRQLDEQRDKATQKVDQLVTASGTVWKDVEDALAHTLKSLKQSYEEARDEFSHSTSPPKQ